MITVNPTFYIEIDLTTLGRFKRMSPNRKSKIFEKAARRYTDYLRKRFLSLSAMTGGSAQWPKLAEITIKHKERAITRGDGRINISNPEWILRESNTLSQGLGYKLNPTGFNVGYVTVQSHPNAPMSVAQLAEIHQFGAPERNLPARPILIYPDARLKRMLIKDIENSFGEVFREVNKGRTRRG